MGGELLGQEAVGLELLPGEGGGQCRRAVKRNGLKIGFDVRRPLCGGESRLEA
jgi:hypothetical protein